MTSKRACGISAATSAPTRGGRRLSSSPARTSVGAAIRERRACPHERSGVPSPRPLPTERPMTELKFERKETLMREEAVALLRSIADALDGSDRQAELELGSDTISLPVGSEIRMELEVELDDDELELELELKWAVQEPAAHEPESS